MKHKMQRDCPDGHCDPAYSKIDGGRSNPEAIPKRFKRALLSLILLSAVILTANLPTSIQVGVNGHYRAIRMPLYIKWTQFLGRHYEYKRLSKEITAGRKTDDEKASAILKWTKDSLRHIPPGMPQHDDHILNIIIRGYAVPEQFQDVFTTLCSYSGMPAFYEKVFDGEHKSRYLSFVKISGKWRVFDAYEGTPYEGSRFDLSPAVKPMTSRAEKQMPLHRIIFEIRKTLKLEKE